MMRVGFTHNLFFKVQIEDLTFFAVSVKIVLLRDYSWVNDAQTL